MYEEDFRNTVAEYTGDIGLSPDEKIAAMKAKAKEEAQQDLFNRTANKVITQNLTEEQALS